MKLYRLTRVYVHSFPIFLLTSPPHLSPFPTSFLFPSSSFTYLSSPFLFPPPPSPLPLLVLLLPLLSLSLSSPLIHLPPIHKHIFPPLDAQRAGTSPSPELFQTLDQEKMVLVERMCKLKREMAKLEEKTEFFEEHAQQLTEDIQRKSK